MIETVKRYAIAASPNRALDKVLEGKCVESAADAYKEYAEFGRAYQCIWAVSFQVERGEE